MKKPKPCITLIKHSGHLKTLEKCREHSSAARVFCISLVFSNARRVIHSVIHALGFNCYLLNNVSTMVSNEWKEFSDHCLQIQR